MFQQGRRLAKALRSKEVQLDDLADSQLVGGVLHIGGVIASRVITAIHEFEAEGGRDVARALLSAGDGPKPESVMPGSPITPSIEVFKYMGVLWVQDGFAQWVKIGSFHRAGNYLVTCRHVLDSPDFSGYWQRHNSYGVTSMAPPARDPFPLALSQDILSSVNFSYSDQSLPPFTREYYGSAHDVVLLELRHEWWAATGIQAMKLSALCPSSQGQIEVYSQTTPGVCVKALGPLSDPDFEEQRQKGILGHMASTESGFSGSLLLTRRNGACRIAGMHIGSMTNGSENKAITVSGLKYWYRKVGLLPTISPSNIIEHA